MRTDPNSLDASTAVRVEHAVRLTWPGGYSEIHERDSRREAETAADRHAYEGCDCRAELIRRTVIVGEWEPIR